MMPHMRNLLLSTVLLLGLTTAHAKEIVGYAEYARIYPGALEINTRIDTGANLASLNCNCITPIKRDGEEWVSFSVTNSQGQVIRLEKKILRTVTIKRHFGETQQRFVIMLGICLGNVYHDTEVTLIDREGLTYPMLLGRAFLGADFLVDSSAQHINPPKCELGYSGE